MRLESFEKRRRPEVRGLGCIDDGVNHRAVCSATSAQLDFARTCIVASLDDLHDILRDVLDVLGRIDTKLERLVAIDSTLDQI